MRARRPVTSRQTIFRPPPPPDKQAMSIEDMLRASYLLGHGEKIRDVARSVSSSPTSIHRVKQRATGRVVTVKEWEYDRAILAHFIALCLLENPRATGQSIFHEATKLGLKTSVTSVNRIAIELNFRLVMTQKQEKLSSEQKAYRVKFCNDIRLWFWYNLPWVFTDETMLVLNPVKKRIRVIRGLDVDDKFMEVSGYPAKVMVWAAVGRDFKSPLVRVTNTLNATEYQKLLTDCKIFELLDARYGRFAYVFQQDGARPHTAKTTIQFLQSRAKTLPPSCHWPACSPDLNIIENLWSILKYSMNYGAMRNPDEMFQEAVRVWNGITIDTINKLTMDFAPRLDTCRAVKGECINRHKQVLRGFRISAEEGQRALSTSLESAEKIREFKEKSRAFFIDFVPSFTPWNKMPSGGEARSLKLALNDHLGLMSASICLTLPESILRKTSLPMNPVAHEKTVLAEEPAPDQGQ